MSSPPKREQHGRSLGGILWLAVQARRIEDDGVRAYNQCVGVLVRDVHGLSDSELASIVHTVRAERLVDLRRLHLELGNESREEVSPAGRR